MTELTGWLTLARTRRAPGDSRTRPIRPGLVLGRADGQQADTSTPIAEKACLHVLQNVAVIFEDSNREP